MKDYHERLADIARAWDEARPRVLPVPWLMREPLYANAAWYRREGVATFKLLACVEVEAIRSVDGSRFDLWLHLSCSAPGRTPFWNELKEAKEVLLGDRRAVMVLPPKAEYVNINPHVLHLYAPVERDPMPDFRGQDSRGAIGL